MKYIKKFENYDLFKNTKIIDSEGFPLVVWRASSNNDKLNINRLSNNKGLYFSANRESVKIYGDNIKSYILNIQNPLILKDKEWNLSVIPDYLYNILIKKGYDGAVWIRNSEMYEIVAFYPEQIKEIFL